MGYSVILRFSIYIHLKDRHLLQKVAIFFGVGSIKKGTNESFILYRVSSLQDIVQVIIPRPLFLFVYS
jgi:hypothetical protein